VLNVIWSTFLILGIVAAAFTGKMDDVTTAVIRGGMDAVQLAITMAGVVATWSGIMRIAERGGMIEAFTKWLDPLLSFLFPQIPKRHKARQYIATNFAANFLGLGWAATPAGLLAMKELQKLNKKKDIASPSMCMFLVINMSSLQLITVNVIAYRAQYGSANPSEIIGAGIFATVISTLAGVIAVKAIEGWCKRK
jgi:spore maturation protein A